MVIEQVKISKLKKAEYNPRKISEKQMSELKDSLIKFGFVDPVIVNKPPGRKNIIVGGHQRVTAWGQLGYDDVPVYYVDLTEAKEKELNVRLNKSGGQFDMALLNEFFDKNELLELGFDDVELADFSEIDLDNFSNNNDYSGLNAEDKLNRFLDAKIKKITIPFESSVFDIVVPRLEKLMKTLGVDDYSSLILKILDDAKI